ncbi:copper-translocating P-type ATPase [Vibrio ostreicida]|uniref:Copper-exporting P-type ATPase n=1 Tax=Vibrio ostreicida TaxID=526588 RepID=A0ABT8BT80_9VIBR|nr:copper-translocating P-type ATPase [Vibrio ostreicida]MDN3609337.1 copper-translocating P-type ATPase [Vibrio ostreicida]NPD08229.1 copper-translocating P-type ATPase [Vibrio ostreicida]
MHQFTIPLAGLHCMGCVEKVKQALVSEHQVVIQEISPQHLLLESDSDFNALATSIRSLGYQAGHQYHFNLSGLNCGRCVAKLRSLLESNSLIDEIDVSTTTLSLSTLLSQKNIEDMVASLGYQANSPSSVTSAVRTEGDLATPEHQEDMSGESASSIHLLITGMTCASCVASVERALTKVQQVARAQVNLAEQRALVFTNINNSTTLNAITAAVEEAGYQAEIIDDPTHLPAQQLAQQSALQSHHKRSAVAGMVIGIPLMLWGLLGGNMMISTSQNQLGWAVIGILCLWLLATAGQHFYLNAWKALIHRRATMDTLVALGTGAAWLYSMLVVIFPHWFPAASRHVYFEASAMIVGLISLGHYIEAKAKAKTTRSLQALVNLQPNEATQVTPQGDKTITISQIVNGMHLRIKPGEKAPVDGQVVSGESYIDESMLTGEAIPVFKQSGDTVSAGTLNQDGSLMIQATSVGSNTMLSRIITMVREAQSSKPAIAKLADQISSVFVPVVVAIALLAAAVWFMVGPEPRASYMLVVATTVLIIACPCALGLATPLSVTVGIGKAAEMGILIKDADVLQSASKVDTVVFDKTGTLTQGKPDVQHLFASNGNEEQLLVLAASLEQGSEHPLAKAIVRHSQKTQQVLYAIEGFRNQRGIGVFGYHQQQEIGVVSLPYALQQGWDLSALQADLDRCSRHVWTPVIVVQQLQVIGLIAISDPIKPDAKAAVEALIAAKVTPVMLSGDHRHVAESIAKQLGIEQVIAQVLPDQKAGHIKALQTSGHHVAMIGDGVNDAPALAQADIGIAMGSGSDVAIESAQMTLLNSSPLAVVKAIELSKATVLNMKQNLFGAFLYNSLGIPIAAGILYPSFGFLLSPVVAGAAMALSSITVVSNANRLRLFKPS